jgi:hypothetical protein
MFAAFDPSLTLIDSLLPLVPELGPLADARAALRPQAQALGQRAEDPRGILVVEAFERDLANATESLLRLDGSISLSLFREIFDPENLSRAELAQYAALLAHHSRGNQDRVDRVDYVVTHLAADRASNGEWTLRPYLDLEALLRPWWPDIGADPAAREAACAFFHAAVRRLEEFGKLQELVDSNVLHDTRGYRIALGRAFLDLEILYASATFETAASNRMLVLGRQEGKEPPQVRELLLSIQKQADLVFRSPDAQPIKFDRPVVVEKAVAPTDGREQFGPQAEKLKAARARKVRLTTLAVLLVVGGAVRGVMAVDEARGGKLTPVSEVEKVKLSPVLLEASYSNGPRKIMIARVDSTQWLVLPRSERRKIAEGIAAQLGSSGVTAAMVFSGAEGSRVAFEIEDGKVVLLE